MKRMNKQLQKGFTLLELLVVVSILAIIAGAVISAISGQEETAGQGVALNTMGALENATRQHVVIANGLPSGLDSLICADLSSATFADSSDIGGTPALMGTATTAVATGGFAGGLAPGLNDATDGKLVLATLPAPGAEALVENGIVSLRYAEADACDEDGAATDTTGELIGGVAATDDADGLDEVLAQTVFWDVTAGGYGANVAIDDAATLPVAILRDPTDIGQDENNVIGVFGVGNFSDLSANNIISRGPIDGNVDGEGQYYSHFSLAIRLGDVNPAGTSDLDAGTIVAADYPAEADDVAVEIVAVLDSDGDNFDDEVAEFQGLEDE